MGQYFFSLSIAFLFQCLYISNCPPTFPRKGQTFQNLGTSCSTSMCGHAHYNVVVVGVGPLRHPCGLYVSISFTLMLTSTCPLLVVFVAVVLSVTLLAKYYQFLKYFAQKHCFGKI